MRVFPSTLDVNFKSYTYRNGALMNLDHLEFEQPIAELQQKIEELRRVSIERDINIGSEIERLEDKRAAMTRQIFGALSAHQTVQMARHPLRPYTADYIRTLFTDFDELQGDRHTAAAYSIVGGLARLDGRAVVVLGHQKGRTTQEKLKRNFGMPNPEGFRKALRLVKLAEKFRLPVFTFIDTPGAYPGIGAEERNQSEAIARNLFEFSTLKVPVICTIIGEGCSGGALAIGVGDRLLMLQYSYYSVISPEGCASILWKKSDRAPEAAAALNLTADRLLELGLIDEVIPEPLGGAHRDLAAMAAKMKQRLSFHLRQLDALPVDKMLATRYEKLIRVS